MRIEHSPLGDEHPYAQLPTERSPRFPLAGQAISVGFALEFYGDDDDSVRESGALPPVVRWRLDGGVDRIAVAQPVEAGEGGRAACAGEATAAGVVEPAPAGTPTACAGGAYLSGPGLDATSHAGADAAGDAAADSAGDAAPSPRNSAARPPRLWSVTIPACPAGARLTYRICTGAVETAEYAVTVGSIARAVAVSREPAETGGSRGTTHREVRADGGTVAMRRDSPEAAAVRGAGHRDTHASGGTAAIGFDSTGSAVLRLSLDDGSEATVELEGSGAASAEPRLIAEECRLERLPAERPDRLILVFESPADERFFGFGERFDRLDRRGTVVDTRVYEQYLEQGNRSYIPMPCFLSSRGYAMHINTSRNVVFDLAAAAPDRYSVGIELPDEEARAAVWIGAGTPAELLDELTGRTGRPAVPPEWAFGPWMSANEWNSQRRVMDVVERTRELDIPASVIVIEAWSDESTFYVWNDAEYRPVAGGERLRYDDFRFPENGLWPDPKGMIETLHDYGMRVLLWQIPVYKHQHEGDIQHDADWRHMVDNGYAVRRGDRAPGSEGDVDIGDALAGDAGQANDGIPDSAGDSADACVPTGAVDRAPYRVRPPWFHGSLVLDVTSDEALEWWFAKRRYLLEDLGIDGFKTDGGEHVWGYRPRYADGRTGADLWNEYPKRYVDAYHGEASRMRGGDAITFSRAGFSGSSRSPLHWCGDQPSTWHALRSVYRAAINASLSGIPLIGWDIGGFSGPLPDPELYMRAAAAALFSPLFQYHSEYNDHRTPCVDRTPWNIAERFDASWLIGAFRRLAKLREALRGYIVGAAGEASRSGRPLMRPLFFDSPDDPTSWNVGDQYRFGDDLLVCPVFAAGVRKRPVYLPPGRWIEPVADRIHNGGVWITGDAPAGRIPVYVRAESARAGELGGMIRSELAPGGDSRECERRADR